MTFCSSLFNLESRTKVVYGCDAVTRVGLLARELDGQSALLVTDPGVHGAGHCDHVRKILEASGVRVNIFDGVHENPTTDDVNACVAKAQAADSPIDLIVGLGGGSSLDTAKGCNFLLTNGGEMVDYWGVGKADRPMLPLIAIPTTAGTGSECQSFALIADAKNHQKMACGDPKAAAAIAILDPKLTTTLPPLVTACTGLDAITHAVESFVTTRRNAFSTMVAAQSFSLLISHFHLVLSKPDDLEARGAMLWSASLAGMAIENSMLGAAHAAANPLTARYGMTHGHAVGLMLPHVIRFNAQDHKTQIQYAQLACSAGCVMQDADESTATHALLACIEEQLGLTGLSCTIHGCGVKESAIVDLADEAVQQWTAQFNPRPIARNDFIALYKAAFN